MNLAKGFRGGERQTELLVRGLAEKGLEQVLVARKGQPLTQRLSDVPRLRTMATVANPFLAWSALPGCDLLHAHEAKAAHACYIRQLFSAIPYVITRRVVNAPKPNRFTKNVYGRARQVVAVSGAIANVMDDYLDLHTPVIPDALGNLPVDEKGAAALATKYAGRFLIGHIGELDSRHKGQIYLIRAARELQKTHPSIQFILLGRGKDEEWLRSEAKGLQNVSFEGYVHNVGDFLSVFDMFVFPSLHEGLGSTLLDAMHFGLPVVASRIDGIPELVRNGENGLLVPPADPAALIDSIAVLYSDRPRRTAMGEKARAFAENFTPEIMAQRYLKLYDSLLSPGSREEALT